MEDLVAQLFKEDVRELLTWLGGGIVVCVSGLWALFKYIAARRNSIPERPISGAQVNKGVIAGAVHGVVIQGSQGQITVTQLVGATIARLLVTFFLLGAIILVCGLIANVLVAQETESGMLPGFDLSLSCGSERASLPPTAAWKEEVDQLTSFARFVKANRGRIVHLGVSISTPCGGCDCPRESSFENRWNYSWDEMLQAGFSGFIHYGFADDTYFQEQTSRFMITAYGPELDVSHFFFLPDQMQTPRNGLYDRVLGQGIHLQYSGPFHAEEHFSTGSSIIIVEAVQEADADLRRRLRCSRDHLSILARIADRCGFSAPLAHMPNEDEMIVD